MDEKERGGVAGAVLADVHVAVFQAEDRAVAGVGDAARLGVFVGWRHAPTVTPGTRPRLGRMFPLATADGGRHG